MEIKLPDAFSTPDSRNFPFGFQPSAFSEAVLKGETGGFSSVPIEATDVSDEDEEAYGLFLEFMDETAELLSRFDRELKYEVIEEAGMVQIQVIDGRDGHVVRKIPADEVIRFIETLRERVDDHMDVWA